MDFEKLADQLYQSLLDEEFQAAVELLRSNAGLAQETSVYEDPWIVMAADLGANEVCKILLELGVDINEPGEDAYALEQAIASGHLETVELLIANGADPNLGRTLAGAYNTEQPDNLVPIVGLLLEKGVDVNQTFEMFGDPNNLRTALDWSPGDDEYAELLRNAGGLTYAELQEQGRG